MTVGSLMVAICVYAPPLALRSTINPAASTSFSAQFNCTPAALVVAVRVSGAASGVVSVALADRTD